MVKNLYWDFYGVLLFLLSLLKIKILKLKGGPKKKNGHKPDCDCPICKNMKNKHGRKTKKYRGGGDDDDEEQDEEEDDLCFLLLVILQ